MTTIKSRHKQSLLDISIQEFGSINEVFALCNANNLSITSVIAAGTELLIPELKASEPEIQDYYKRKNLKPATALTQLDIYNLTQANPCNIASLFL